METMGRTVVKAATWQGLGILTMTALSYPQTGSLTGALSIAVSASASGFVFYLVHEKIWNAVRWGRQPALASRPETSTVAASAARQPVLEEDCFTG
ncbi:DUF2061 domain-containing protein [uncultured Roseibium sp.]|uniref:DUF2061 domain-containing protein n=1 Tax=uncultured Roseibium sp. TaxID=1936171 RepID=UPI003217E149